MKKLLILALTVMTVFYLSACEHRPAETTDFPETEPPASSTAKDTAPETSEPAQTTAAQPEHSPLYLPEVSVEDVLLYFNEVCLDSEITNSGDPSVIQKWVDPIYCMAEGSYTDSDIEVLDSFIHWLNTIEGFPGISRTEDIAKRNLRICFCDQQEMLSIMGQNFTNMDGAVTFWYLNDEIYDAVICCRTDLDQQLRNSVILEEIYNGLGPIQDTSLRPDSVIYQEYSQPQWLSPVDILILQLLYHPDIQPGMDAAECEEVIRRLYY